MTQTSEIVKENEVASPYGYGRGEILERCARDLVSIGDPDTALAVRELATLTAACEPAPESIADQFLSNCNAQG